MELKSFVCFVKINLHFIITQNTCFLTSATAHKSPDLKFSKEFGKTSTDYSGF